MTAKESSKKQLKYQAKRHALGQCWYSGCKLPIEIGGRCKVHYQASSAYLKGWLARKKAWKKEFEGFVEPPK